MPRWPSTWFACSTSSYSAPSPARATPGPVALGVDVRLADGREDSAALGDIEVVAPAPAPVTSARPAAGRGALIAVCMATFEPDRHLLQTQIRTLREQTDQD